MITEYIVLCINKMYGICLYVSNIILFIIFNLLSLTTPVVLIFIRCLQVQIVQEDLLSIFLSTKEILNFN